MRLSAHKKDYWANQTLKVGGYQKNTLEGYKKSKIGGDNTTTVGGHDKLTVVTQSLSPPAPVLRCNVVPPVLLWMKPVI